jgi:predicted nuclease of restriction endonuclease-like (RecB) superfamily
VVESADTVCGFDRRNLLKDFADAVYEIELARGAQIFFFWSHYVRLLSVTDLEARRHCEDEALRGGWSVRQLDRQVSALSFHRSGTGHLKHNSAKKSSDAEIKDPFVLEFLGLKDGYSESELEDALIGVLEQVWLELGNNFAFVARQKRLRVGKEWYRVDLLFFHRKLRSLIVVGLKLDKFTHADAGQMNLYLNYAREHWTNPDENPPVGLILCSEHDAAVAHYSLGNLGNQVVARDISWRCPPKSNLPGNWKLGVVNSITDSLKQFGWGEPSQGG